MTYMDVFTHTTSFTEIMHFDSGWWIITLPKTNILPLEKWWERPFVNFRGKLCWFQGRYMIRSKSPTCFISVFFSCFLVVGELLATQVYLTAWSADLRFHILLVPLTARVWTCSDDSLHQFGFAIIALGCEQQWLPGKQNPRTFSYNDKEVVATNRMVVAVFDGNYLNH